MTGRQQRSSDSRRLGRLGEEMVKKHLEQQGFKLLQQNFTVRCGEIDLVASQGRTLLFVEVKTRSIHYFATSQVIVKSKQRKLWRAAQAFLLKHRMSPQDFVLRFDVAVVSASLQEPALAQLQYIPNAFQV